MRLSLKKAAHAGVGGARAGNPDTWAENDIFRLFLASISKKLWQASPSY
jgi:hypothetical protein